MLTTIKIATRHSPLALWQAEFIKVKLHKLYPQLNIELVKMVTTGDKILDVPLAKIGGKGLFIKELEQGILAGIADIAVHSLKDVPMQMPDGFELATICQRENPFDALVSNKFNDISQLPPAAIIGTSSLRRKSQLLALRPDLKVIDLRGNVNTRLAKLDNGEYDGIILAAAGLIRLGMENRIKFQINPSIMLPAVGQGAIGIETLGNAVEIKKLLAPLNCQFTQARVTAERAMNYALDGGCQIPIGGFATLSDNNLTLTGVVATSNGSRVIKIVKRGDKENAEHIGTQLGMELLANGADEILREIY